MEVGEINEHCFRSQSVGASKVTDEFEVHLALTLYVYLPWRLAVCLGDVPDPVAIRTLRLPKGWARTGS
jgi:hypothetical protein